MYDEDPATYMPLLRLTASEYTAEDRPEDVLTSTLDLITSHALVPDLSTLQLALSLHTTAPRIEAAYSWYEDRLAAQELVEPECGTWVEWRGKGFCDLDRLKSDMELTIEEGQYHA